MGMRLDKWRLERGALGLIFFGVFCILLPHHTCQAEEASDTPYGPGTPECSSLREENLAGSPLPRVFVRDIRVTGNTVCSDEELAEVARPYTDRPVTALDLEMLRQALTQYYVDRGYINSGAVLPDQEIAGGRVTFEIVEGRLTDISVEGNKWFKADYFAKRIAYAAGRVLNINTLEESLQLLQQDDRVTRLHGELRPVGRLGESELQLQVEEAVPVGLLVGFNNYQSPTVGAEQGFAALTHRCLTGNGDTLSFTYGRSAGSNPQIDAWYALPFTPSDTSLILRYRKNSCRVVESVFERLDIVTESDTYGVTLRQPAFRDLHHDFSLAVSGEYLPSESSLLGEPFSFHLGAVDGKSKVAVLRFAQDYIYRSQDQVIAARSRLSLGVDALGATIHGGPLPDSQYFAWLGQFQWARMFTPWAVQGIFRTDVQLAADSLLPVEQIPVGGRYSVRGYRENQLVRDNGVIASVEARIPLIGDTDWADHLQVVPFFDFGKGWNTRLVTPAPEDLASIGVGLRWGASLLTRPFPVRPEFEIYWGYRLLDAGTAGNNLQDHGIHLQFTLSAF